MSIVIDEIGMLNKNIYDRMLIRQENNKYVVSLSGNKFSEVEGLSEYKLSYDYNRYEDKDILKTIINNYLEMTEVREIIDVSEELVIVNGNRSLMLKINSEDLKWIYDILMDEYVARRDLVSFLTDDVKHYSFGLSDFRSAYDFKYTNGTEKRLCYTLKCGRGGKIYEKDKEFAQDLLMTKFNDASCDARVLGIYKEKAGELELVGYMFKCGDFKITMPVDSRLTFLFNVVNEYNGNIRMNKKKILKKEFD